MANNNLTEQESLQLISEMIQKAKKSYYEKGISSILWGSVITFCGIVNFIQIQFDINFLKFDVWILTLIAIVPQIYLSINEARTRKIVAYEDAAVNAVWFVFGISLFAFFIYTWIVPNAIDRYFIREGIEILEKNKNTGATENFHFFIPSVFSLYLIFYAFPTLVTGLAKKFKPMLYGAILCYILFIISCFTITKYDLLLQSLAAIFCWLIPGVILNKRYRKANSNV